MKIYVFGNELVKKDSLPISLLPKLQKKFPQIDFIAVDPNENFPPKEENKIIILDTVFGLKKPQILDLNDFEKNKKTPISPHDYDLLFHLLLLKKMKRLSEVKIIGIPVVKDENILTKIEKIIASLLLENVTRRTCKGQMP